MFKLKKLIRLSYNFIFKTKRRYLTIMTIFHMAIAKVRIKRYAGNSLHKFLGVPGESELTVEYNTKQKKDMYFVADKVARISVNVPWESKCLVQAMAAQRLLKFYGIPSTLYLGVGRDPKDNSAIAHAWVRCGENYICGGNGAEYAIVAKFVWGRG